MHYKPWDSQGYFVSPFDPKKDRDLEIAAYHQYRQSRACVLGEGFQSKSLPHELQVL
jgi:hypothetical protein